MQVRGERRTLSAIGDLDNYQNGAPPGFCKTALSLGAVFLCYYQCGVTRLMSEHRILEEILERITRIEEKIMSTSPVTREQLDEALTSAVTTITTALSDLQAKIAAGTVTTPEDFSAELAQIQGLVSTATADDPGPTPPAIPAS